MEVGLVVYDGIDQPSGGYRYDRQLVAALEDRGDTVELLSIPRRSYSQNLRDGFSSSLQSKLDRQFDVLLQDELCHPTLWRQNDRLEEPTAIVSIVHLLRSEFFGSGYLGGVRKTLSRSIERRYLDSVDAAVCTSRDTRDRTEALSSIPTVVAPPAGRFEGAALEETAVATRARRLDEGEPLRVASVGSVIPRKGLRTLLRALEELSSEWELTVVGSLERAPSYARSTIEFARGLESRRGARIEFLGTVSDAKLEDVLRRTHVLAVPSYYEGFGMSYLEAMEFGVVPIASAVGGAREFVDHGTNGYLVEPGDPDAIAAILETLAADGDRLASLGASALATASSHPTWAESMTRVRNWCLDVVREKRDSSVLTSDTRGVKP